jgi:hypothetical protein
MREEGDMIAGERPPKKDVLAHVLTSALTAGGYRPATREHPASLLILYLWGSFNRVKPLPDPSLLDAGIDTSQLEDDLGELSDPTVVKNRLQRAAIIGGTHFAMELAEAFRGGRMGLETLRHRDAKTEWLVDEVAYTDRYFLIASAYDVAAAEKGVKKLMWRTKISTDARGLSMNESLPALVSNAGPYFGREMTEVATLKPRLLAGRVEVGTPTVQEYLEDRAAEKKTVGPASPVPPAAPPPARAPSRP